MMKRALVPFALIAVLAVPALAQIQGGAPNVTNATGTLPAARGGTGLASYTIGDLLYASGTTTLSKLAGVATGQVLVSGGAGVAPAWSASPTMTGPTITDGATVNSTSANIMLFQNSGTAKLRFGTSFATNGIINGSVAGDTVIRAISQKIMFSSDDGVTSDLTIPTDHGFTIAKLSGAPASGPGAGRIRIFAVAGTNANTCKLQAQAGTSSTAVTILDNIGGSC